MKRTSIVVLFCLCVLALCSLVLNQAKLAAEGPASAPIGSPAKQLTLDLGKGIAMKLTLIPAGKFLMGSPAGEKDRNPAEGPQHEVAITKPFYMGVYEVTQAQYEAIMGKNPSVFKSAKNPVESVSWEDAVEFCKKLSQKTGKTVRLPTEAEWEYACRAGTKTRFSFGDADADLHKYGNYCDKSNTNGFQWQDKAHDDGHDKTAPVGSYKPNPFGLYDIHGNVDEWCSDWYAESYAKAGTRDPQGPTTGIAYVVRGGCWRAPGVACSSASRLPRLPTRHAKSKADAAMQKLQATMVKMEFENQELGLVIDYLREITDLPIHVKWRALETAEITPRTPVNIKLKNVSAAKALDILLGDLGSGEEKLAYKIDNEGLITITTAADQKDAAVVTRTIGSFFDSVGFRVVTVGAAGAN